MRLLRIPAALAVALACLAASADPLPTERKQDLRPLAPGQLPRNYVRATDFNALLDHTSGWVNAKSYGVACSTTDDAALLAQAATAASSAGSGLLIPCKVRVASAAGTISVPVRFEGGGSLDLRVGGSVTLSGSMDAPQRQVFFSNGGTLTFGAKVGQVVPQWWGAVGDGTTDDTAAIQAALNVGRRVYFPAGTYLATSLSMPAGSSLVGENKLTTTIKRTSTSNFIPSLPAGAVIRDITLDGNAGSYASGNGVLVAAGAGRQTIDNARLRNWPSTALEFAADGGSEFKAINATFHTTGTAGSVAAVVMVPTGTDAAATPRHFKSIESEGCTLFSFGGVDHVWAAGFYTNGLLFTSASAFNVELREFRAGALGGTITVQGDSHFMSGVSAVAWIIKSTSSIYHVQAPNWDLTEQSPAANNSIEIINPSGGGVAWTPTVTASGGGFAIGTGGTITSRYSRRGAWIKAEIAMQLGTGFTIGSGALQFSLPVAGINVSPVQVCGVAYIINSGATQAYVGAVQIAAGASVATIKTHTSGHAGVDAGQFGPITWDANSTIRLSFEYRVP